MLIFSELYVVSIGVITAIIFVVTSAEVVESSFAVSSTVDLIFVVVIIDEGIPILE